MMAEHAHILVVDDEPQITRVLRTTLVAQGYDIRVANDGEMALEIMKDWSPHLIITDLSMPRLNGVELCRRVRAVSQVPILVLSVRDQERQKIEALDAGADDYITKPFSMNELLARVRANLRRDAEITGRRRCGRSRRLPHRSRHPHRLSLRTRTQAHSKGIRPAAVFVATSHTEWFRTALCWPRFGEPTAPSSPNILRVFIGQLRKKARSRSGRAALHADRALGGLPLRTRQLIFTNSLSSP